MLIYIIDQRGQHIHNFNSDIIPRVGEIFSVKSDDAEMSFTIVNIMYPIINMGPLRHVYITVGVTDAQYEELRKIFRSLKYN